LQSVAVFRTPERGTDLALGASASPTLWQELRLIAAGVLLGLTIAIRVLGPLPGAIVVLNLVLQGRPRLPRTIDVYLLSAAATALLTWPYLWPAPFAHFAESIAIMANFAWHGLVLFNGTNYAANDLPRTYLPVLLTIQLTETTLLAIYSGATALGWMLLRRRVALELLVVVTVGGLLPLAGLIALRSTMYNNFRQILFLLPPLLLFAGPGLNALLSSLRFRWMRLLVLLVLVAPGILAILDLHPYEYVYYNQLVGGVRGAEDRFDLDYWHTAFRELTLGLNSIAFSDPNLLGQGSLSIIKPYMRPDFRVEQLGIHPDPRSGGYDYAILSATYNDDNLHPAGQILIRVERDGVTLGVVKAIVGASKH